MNRLPKVLARVGGSRFSTQLPLNSLPRFRSLPAFSSRPFSAVAAPVEAVQPSEKREQDTTAVAAKAPSSLSDIVNKYGGWYPLVGLGVVAALSKELILVDAELLMGCNVALMAVGAYYLLGDTVRDALNEPVLADKKSIEDCQDLYIDGLKQLLKAHESSIAQVEVLNNYITEYTQVNKDLSLYQNAMVRKAVRDAVEKRLQDIKAQEDNRFVTLKKDVAIKATQFVRDQFANAPAALKTEVLTGAINEIGGTGATDPKKDPVKRLFFEYLDNWKKTAKI